MIEDINMQTASFNLTLNKQQLILYSFSYLSFCKMCLLFDLVDELWSVDHRYLQLNEYNI